jgi:hypothetical protein
MDVVDAEEQRGSLEKADVWSFAMTAMEVGHSIAYESNIKELTGHF